jgi:hypothetical protein
MVETVIPLIVTIASGLLCVYWFRYACLLILVAKSPRDYARGVELANQLRFSAVQIALRKSATELPSLKKALDRDFRVLNRLLVCVAASTEHEEAIERLMLRINYWTMRAWCSATWRISPAVARRALQEMAVIVAHFASTLGERLAQVRSSVHDASVLSSATNCARL